MSFVPFSSIVRSGDDAARARLAFASSKAARKPSPPRKGPAALWAAWATDGTPSSGLDFIEAVLSWTEGTAAQLLRPQWPAAVKRPTSRDVRQRLSHHLGMAARRGVSTYLEALEQARRAVIEELRQARAM